MNRLEATRYAGRINSQAIEAGFFVAQPGRTLLEINDVVEKYLLEFDCVPIFKGYRGFPAACCLSPNDIVVHGVPSDYVLKAGDLLTVDVGCSHEGWCVDSARTRVIGLADPSIFPFQERLALAAESVLEAEIAVIKNGVTLLEIIQAAESKAKDIGVNIYPQWGGHGIGQELHMTPFILNCIDPSFSKLKRWKLERENAAIKLEAGNVICLEPVVTFGKTDIIVDDDGWTVRSKDGSLVAHAERCILITETGYDILS